MHLALEVVLFILKFFYYIIEGIIKACIPVSLRPRKSVAGQKVLITGAGSGLGRLMAYRFAELGSTLILWDINKEGNEETARVATEKGASVHTYVVDLSVRTAIYDVANQVKNEVGEVDILVNNAGIVTGKSFLECPDALIEKSMDVNCNALFWTTKAFMPSMLERNSGHIVNIASCAGLFGVKQLADYCASKFAAVGFTESLRHELYSSDKTGVKTTVVCPFFINTGMFDGVTTRFPRILPIVEPEFAVQRMMDAILTNQEQILIPDSCYILYALKGMMSTKLSAESGDFFGVNDSMATYVGRKKTN